MRWESTIIPGHRAPEINLSPIAPVSASQVWVLWQQAAKPFSFGYRSHVDSTAGVHTPPVRRSGLSRPMEMPGSAEAAQRDKVQSSRSPLGISFDQRQIKWEKPENKLI